MVKLLVGALLALSAVNSVAGNMSIFKNKDGQVLITSVNPSSNIAKKAKTYTASEVSKKIGKRPSTSEVVVRPSAKKHIYSTNQTSSKDTYIKTDKKIQTFIHTDNVAKFYKPVEWTQSQKQNFEYRKGLEEVRIIESDDLIKSFNSLSANGYSVLGSSEFLDRKLPHSIFKSQAIKIGAETVVIYRQGVSEVPYHVDDDLNNLDYAYKYDVVFYVKNNSYKQPNMMGISMTEIPLDERKLYQRNTGVYVVNVIKDARAYFANVVVEDVIIAVNGKEVRSPEDLGRIRESELKTTKNLNLTIIRLVNNEPREIQIPINFN